MLNKFRFFGSIPKENIPSALPAALSGILVLATIILTTLLFFQPVTPFRQFSLGLLGILGLLFFAFFRPLYIKSTNKHRYVWANAIGISLYLVFTILTIPPEIDYLIFPFMLVAATTIVHVSSRKPVYFLILIGTAGHFVHLLTRGERGHHWIVHIGLAFGVIIAMEAILQLKQMAQKQITRLEIINEISRQIVLTLDTSQLLSLLNAAFQNALEADTYYIGIVDGAELHMQLFYDDGEYFNDLRVKREGLLSDWVIKNQQPLFLPDLRNEVRLEGVNYPIIGKDKPSVSWVGVPMKATNVEGVIVIGSYQANAFDRSDLELLLNISQRAALALDNTYHHAHIQREARLDSLTRVFNHGHFIQMLQVKAEECDFLKQSLSLIMLDIDKFKHYNDHFGHQVGDEVLVRLCEIIRSNIKGEDIVGRWGGEEFAVALPNANGDQALEVAQRIRKMLASMKLNGHEHLNLPVPTISQGIAIYPLETSEVPKLIDLADQRLYLAKERGRDQIEPAPDLKPALA